MEVSRGFFNLLVLWHWDFLLFKSVRTKSKKGAVLFLRSPIALQGVGISQHKESSVADFHACSGIVDITQLPIVPACCAHSANHCDLMNPLSVQSHSATSTKQTMLVISNWQKPGIIEQLARLLAFALILAFSNNQADQP